MPNNSDNRGEYGEVKCPLPTCHEEVGVKFHGWAPLYDPAASMFDDELIDFNHSVTTGWVIECHAGHLVRTYTDQIHEQAELDEDIDTDPDCAPPVDVASAVAALDWIAQYKPARSG